MKILFLIHSKVVSGAEKSLLSLISGLVDKGHMCIIATPYPSLLRSVFSKPGVTYKKVSSLYNIERRFVPWYLAKILFNIFRGSIKLAKITRRHQIDIIHANSIACGIYGGVIGRLSRCKVVMHVRDMPTSKLTRFLVRILVKYWIHKTIFVSKATANHYFSVNKRNKRWVIIYNGIDQASFSELAEKDETNLKKQGVDLPGKGSIGIVGLLTPWKGHHFVIHAFAEIVKNHPKARLWIVGSGNDRLYREQLERQVRSLRLNGKVIFTGYVPEVAGIIKNLSVLVSASTKPDPLPRTLLEGMALGIPIVAPVIGGIPEQIRDGENGYLFEPENVEDMAKCISELLDNQERAKSFGLASLKMIRERFGISRYVNSVENIYKSLSKV